MILYESGQSDDLPGWANELNIRRMLWKEFGIPFTDMALEQVSLTLDLIGAELKRKSR